MRIPVAEKRGVGVVKVADMAGDMVLPVVEEGVDL